jgi:hypothetical protein
MDLSKVFRIFGYGLLDTGFGFSDLGQGLFIGFGFSTVQGFSGFYLFKGYDRFCTIYAFGMPIIYSLIVSDM